MTITPKIRFEVFKRDNFTCQYCGKKQPDVILHVDHIKSKSNGGNGDMSNLITSCSVCNIGKGAKEIDKFDYNLFKRKNRGLTGKWFHTQDEDGRMKYGKINWQGQILEEKENGTLHIQLYSWLDGCASIQKIVNLEDQKYWQFYETNQKMRDYLSSTYLLSPSQKLV